MKHGIHIGNQTIYCELTRSKRKSVGIAVKADGGVFVSAPGWLPMGTIEEVVRNKADWILKKVIQVKEAAAGNLPKQFRNGECFLYLGEQYPLSISETSAKKAIVGIDCGKLWVGIKPSVDKIKQAEEIRQAVRSWYIEQARIVISRRLEYFGELTGLHPQKVYIKEQKTRWGSCTRENKLNFNWKIVMAPLQVVDYLVVHELCHIREKNHSKKYWELVECILPDYKRNRQWLKQNGSRLTI